MTPELEAKYNMSQDWFVQVNWPLPFPAGLEEKPLSDGEQ